MIEFPQHSECRACPLWENCRTPGMATVQDIDFGDACQRGRQALLVVGKFPAHAEDAEGRPFVGRGGICWRQVYMAAIQSTLEEQEVDGYLTNAVRCKPPRVGGNMEVKPAQIKACRQHLVADVQRLYEAYDGRLTILTLGSEAAKSVFGTTVSGALRRQGEWIDWSESMGIRTRAVASYHPAYVDGPQTSRRQQGPLIRAVAGHLTLLESLLRGEDIRAPWSQEPYTRMAPPPPTPVWEQMRWLSLDIETYGKVETFPPQRHFHPARMEHLDGVAKEDIVQTVALSWRTPDGQLQSTVLPWNIAGIALLYRWLEAAKAAHVPILCMNTVFDIGVLRYVDAYLRQLLAPGEMTIWDLAITNFLDDPERDERSLKDVSVLLGLGAYTEDPDQRHPSKHSRTLHDYNVEDTEKTLISQEIFEERLGGIEPYTFDFYVDVLWNTVEMVEAGMEYDLDRLFLWHDTLERRQQTLRDLAEDEGVPLGGPGSQKSQQEYLWKLFGKHAQEKIGKPETTEKQGLIKTTDEQLARLRTVYPDNIVIRCWQAYKKLDKLLGSNTRVLLGAKPKPSPSQRQSQLTGSRSYPTIYPVRMADKGEDWAISGTKQCRYTYRHPQQNCLTGKIKSFWTSRFDPGKFWSRDASQIELRIAAVLSGEPLMLQDYQRGVDRHETTARYLVEWEIISEDEYQAHPKKYRQLGKTMNFAVLYRCGAQRLVDTIAEKTGIILHKPVAQRLIDAYYKEHTVFAAWQDELIERARKDGRLRIPLLQVGRNYPAGDQTLVSVYSNEIANIQVQGAAACCVHSAQRECHRWCMDRGMRTVIAHNEHDGLYFDSPREEYDAGLPDQFQRLLEQPPYFRDLCESVGRTVPLIWTK